VALRLQESESVRTPLPPRHAPPPPVGPAALQSFNTRPLQQTECLRTRRRLPWLVIGEHDTFAGCRLWCGVVSPCSRLVSGVEYHSNVAMLVRPGETLKLGWSDGEPVIHDLRWALICVRRSKKFNCLVFARPKNRTEL
jgi:hypothetical protein